MCMVFISRQKQTNSITIAIIKTHNGAIARLFIVIPTELLFPQLHTL